jgi:chemotaxis protein CheX
MTIPTVESSSLPKLTDAAVEVFETMVFTTLVAGEPAVNNPPPSAHVVGAVRFLGSLSGTVSFYASNDAAQEIAGQLLGISPEDAADSVCDAIGEVTNMIAGTFRAKMTPSGETLMITTPTVTRGTDFSAQHFNVASRVLCPFFMGEKEVFVELILQQS